MTNATCIEKDEEAFIVDEKVNLKRKRESVKNALSDYQSPCKKHRFSMFPAMNYGEDYDMLWDEMHKNSEDGRELVWLVRESQTLKGTIVISYMTYSTYTGRLDDHACRFMLTATGWESLSGDRESDDIKQRMIAVDCESAKPHFAALFKLLKSKNPHFNSDTVIRPQEILKTPKEEYSRCKEQGFWMSDEESDDESAVKEFDFPEEFKNNPLNASLNGKC